MTMGEVFELAIKAALADVMVLPLVVVGLRLMSGLFEWAEMATPTWRQAVVVAAVLVIMR